jgi:large conductance mechanosensitive channel
MRVSWRPELQCLSVFSLPGYNPLQDEPRGPETKRIGTGRPSSSSQQKGEKTVLKEFKAFAMRGNVMDMAVGIIIGAAFGKIVSSLVEDVMMPPLGQLIGKINFTDFFLSLDGKTYESLEAARRAHAATVNYGIFLNTVINFLIVAFAVFLVVLQVNRWTKKPAPAAVPTTKECPQCAMTIPITARRCGHCTAQLA